MLIIICSKPRLKN